VRGFNALILVVIAEDSRDIADVRGREVLDEKGEEAE